MIVTTSWDDGHPRDQRILRMLADRGLRGTFYLPRQHPECGRIAEGLVRDLHAAGGEIGAHTLSHPDLRRLTPPMVVEEVRASKAWLEDVSGSEVVSFSYPFGRHDARITRLVAAAGFCSARTLRYDRLQPPVDPFRTGISVQAADASPLLVARTWLDLRGPLAQLVDWVERARRAFDVAFERHGAWHLWGHSWEIERNADWTRLERVLDYVAGRPGVRYLTNAGLVRTEPV